MNAENQKGEAHENVQKKSEEDLFALLEVCLNEGWAPTRCPTACRVEPDGVCPHGFNSLALEYGMI